MTRRSSSNSSLFNVNWITGMKVQTTNDKKPVKTILMPFDAMYCSTVAAYIFHLSLSIIRCVRFFLNLTVFVSRSVCGCSSSLLFTVCVCCFLFLPVLNLSILSARPVCINYTHISTNASTLDFFISNELEWASFLWFCFLFLLYFFFFLFCLLYSSSSSSSPSSSFSTVSQHYRWILWPIFLVAWLLYATLRCFINEYVFGWFICVASDG